MKNDRKRPKIRSIEVIKKEISIKEVTKDYNYGFG